MEVSILFYCSTNLKVLKLNLSAYAVNTGGKLYCKTNIIKLPVIFKCTTLNYVYVLTK